MVPDLSSEAFTLARIWLLYAGFRSAPGRTRTCNLRIRSPLLCPIELRAHRLMYAYFSASGASHDVQWQQCGSTRDQSASSKASASPPSTPSTTRAVGARRDRDVDVSERLLREPGMLACHEKYCSASVPEVVQPDGRKFRFSRVVQTVPVVVRNTGPLFCQREPTGSLLALAYSSSVHRCGAVAEGTLERFLAV